eukprot:7566253-Prorocentrum_lima.AAC.1
MTSSLVGSEMCIRDRSGTNTSRSAKSCTELSLFKEPEDLEPTIQQWMCPVSYTHLTLPTICSV